MICLIFGVRPTIFEICFERPGCPANEKSPAKCGILSWKELPNMIVLVEGIHADKSYMHDIHHCRCSLMVPFYTFFTLVADRTFQIQYSRTSII